MTYNVIGHTNFPEFTGIRCYMMPFIQGEPESLPKSLAGYAEFIASNVMERGKIGRLTVDETFVKEGKSQRGYGTNGRTIHTEACMRNKQSVWGGPPPTWGRTEVTLDDNLGVIIANNIDNTCMVWDEEHRNTTPDGDLIEFESQYPHSDGHMMKAGETVRIGIFTPHECINQNTSTNRQFVRIVGAGIHGDSDGFTVNPMIT